MFLSTKGKRIFAFAVFFAALALVFLGIAFGDPVGDIFRKARMICRECMGIG